MTPEQKAAYIMAQAMILHATISGMNAENQQRQLHAQPPKYLAGDFETAVNNSGVHPNAIHEFFF